VHRFSRKVWTTSKEFKEFILVNFLFYPSFMAWENLFLRPAGARSRLRKAMSMNLQAYRPIFWYNQLHVKRAESKD